MSKKRLKILTIDDHYFARYSVTMLLNSGGYSRVISTASAENAMVLFMQQRFNLLIIDVELEGMGGLELIKRIRSGKTAQPAATPIIILTAHAETPVLGTAIALDVNGFIHKDKLEVMLFDKIEQALSEKISIRPALGYSVINTNLQLSSGDGLKTEPGKITETVVYADDFERVPIDKLQPNMEVGEHLYSVKGHLIMPKGHRLTELNICRLWEIHDVFADPVVLITKTSLAVLFSDKQRHDG